MKNEIQDISIIGGGIMGLMTAYYASCQGAKVTILEKSTFGNKEAASFSFTRSYRTDYLDPYYSRLAYESQLLWQDLQEETKEKFIINCGFLNIAKKSVTPTLLETYAEKSYQNIKNLNFQPQKLQKNELQKRYPQIDADLGCLDTRAGFLYLPVITKLLLNLLKENKVNIVEYVKVNTIEEKDNEVNIITNRSIFKSKTVVVTAGLGTNDLLKRIKNNSLILQITQDKPQECKYYYPPKNLVNMFLPKNFPGIAYLDVGIYLHPIFDKKKGAIKIGFYNPPDLKRTENSRINSIGDFVSECLPCLKNARSENVMDADQCSYDLVKDDDFIIGGLPGYKNIIIGTGWRGTGYKFAPLNGKILMQLALQNDTVYNIERFSLKRFVDKETGIYTPSCLGPAVSTLNINKYEYEK